MQCTCPFVRTAARRPSRRRHATSFAAVANVTIDDTVQLDFMALALLTVLLRHRDGWDVTLERIGRRSACPSLRAMACARYLRRGRTDGRGGGQKGEPVPAGDGMEGGWRPR